MSARTRPRDLESEGQLIRDAAKGVTDPEPLIAFAQGRANKLSGPYVPDPMLVRTDVNQPREIREELADGANRLVWWLQDQPELGRSADRRRAALRHLVIAYDLIASDEDQT